MKALGIAEPARARLRFESLQAYYTIAGRDLEREIVPMLASEGLGLMVWSPLAGGLLSGKYRDGSAAKEGARRETFDFPPVDRARADAVIDAMRPIAQARGVSLAQVALGWLLHQPQVTSVIVGAKRPDQLADNIAEPRRCASAPTNSRRSPRPVRCRPNPRAGCWSGRAKPGAARSRSRAVDESLAQRRSRPGRFGLAC